MSSKYLIREGLEVDSAVARLVEAEILPGTGIGPEVFWSGLAGMVRDLGPWNRQLLRVRDAMQERIDTWHKDNPHPVAAAYRAFLREIGYLVPDGRPFEIDTANTDPEVSALAAPQLVVPATSPRFALNAVNARWGSLYDALYGSNLFGDAPEGGYDRARGGRVAARGKQVLDLAVPLRRGRHDAVTAYRIRNGALEPALKRPGQLVGWRGGAEAPDAIVFCHNGLHIEVQINRDHPIGRDDPAGVSDIVLEAAASTIVDLEDSVACVDGADKARAYRCWLGLMRGDLSADIQKDGGRFTRVMAEDRLYESGSGLVHLRGRSVLMVRHVGHHMTTPAVLDSDGHEIPEGMLDALVTTAAALHDLNGRRANSPHGSVYAVKPKLHGPEEVDLTVKIFDRVEDILNLPRNTIKLGLMDEERRTSATLYECLRTARHRIAFVNTGFLDRTASEIHSSMEAAPMVPKADMATATWLLAYEERNVQIALLAGLPGRAQIGKGMWTRTDDLAAMLTEKVAHPMAGASVAWVPSPSAAVLHALHYHQVDVHARQSALSRVSQRRGLDALLTPPLTGSKTLTRDEIARELDRNAQSILGYVVRWVDQGIGCSRVPDIDGVPLMEDRATCRISAQLLANWLHHGLITKKTLRAAFARMAEVVDTQNVGQPGYRPMAPLLDGPAYLAALELVLSGRVQPSGYTEAILHAARRDAKRQLSEPLVG